MIAVFKYTIKDIPNSNNKYMGRSNIWEYQSDKKLWAWLVKSAVGRNKPKEPIKKAIVIIKYYFKDRRRRDPDNYSGKFLLDGLVQARVLEDDSFYNIKLVLEADVDKDNPRTELYIECKETEREEKKC